MHALHSPHILSLYLIRRVCTFFAFGLMIILLALSLERLLRLVDMVSSEGAGIGVSFLLLSYLQPHYLGLAIPASLFLGVLLGFRYFQDNAELVIMQAAGLSLPRLVLPVFCFGIILTLVLFTLISIVQPYGRYAYRAGVQDLKANGSVLRLKPGVFQTFSSGENRETVIRVDSVSRGGHMFRGFFAETVLMRPDGNRSITTITARQAELLPEQAGKKPQLLLQDVLVVKEKNGQDPSLLSVSAYPWLIPLDNISAYGARGQNVREMTLRELWSGGVRGVESESIKPQFSAEIHKRIVQVISLPVLLLLSVPLALLGQLHAGRGRGGQALGLVFGVSVLVLYEKALSVGEASVAQDRIMPMIGIWMPFMALCCLTFLLWFLLQKRQKQTSSQTSSQTHYATDLGGSGEEDRGAS